jgi:hypothetical protein
MVFQPVSQEPECRANCKDMVCKKTREGDIMIRYKPKSKLVGIVLAQIEQAFSLWNSLPILHIRA